MPFLYTAGYEGIDQRSFVNLLQANAVQTLVDVRAVPLSRKPGFSKSAMAFACLAAGIAYVHMVSLGCPKPIRDAYKQAGDWSSYTVRYRDYLASQDAAMASLESRLLSETCCLMCFEADYRQCHRLYVAERAVQMLGDELRLVHLTPKRAWVAPAHRIGLTVSAADRSG